MDVDIVNRTILHIDLDAFFASVEQAMDPQLRGRPVIVGGRRDGRGVVCCASYEARPFGVCAGMPLGHARKLCPQAVFIAGNYHEYQRHSDIIMRLLFDYSPQISTLSIDEACVDLTGTRRIYDAAYGRVREQKINLSRHCGNRSHWAFGVAEHMKRAALAATGLSISIGIAANPVIAKIACSQSKPSGIMQIWPGGEAAFLAGLPVDALPGVGRSTCARLELFGIKTVADLRQLPGKSLLSMFGLHGSMLYERCRGRDSSVVVLNPPPKSISRSTTFSRDSDDMDFIEGMLHYLVERVGVRLRGLGMTARCVHINLRYADFDDYHRTRHLKCATNQDREIFETARRMLHALYTRDVKLRKIGVGVSRFIAGSDFQPDLFSWQGSLKHRRLCSALDRIRGEHGFDAILAGPSITLMQKLGHHRRGFVLHNPSLSR